ncbi:hypothetical protein CLV28_2897 [Sediminihabitans luteus]|uniref:Purine nucleoside phosphorylase n=1 Tax=Sediminihabitans luteus TaxID=1138585 RepID=A0A2M9CCI0_9CELL|nr:hypothetical protein CLV28_2897 [Sediminihabitans luteus]
MIDVDLGVGVRAGFSTRDGGVSRAPWDSLDLGLGTGDDPEDVARNRERASSWVGAEVRFARQVHGTRVELVGQRDGASPGAVPAADPAAGAEPECDAMVAGAGVGLGVLVADCVPVLLADPVAGVVGVAHAGRRGLTDGVVARVVETLAAQGASPARLRAAVGPCVCERCYEVPAALRDEVAAVLPATRATTAWGTPSLDLRAGVEAELRAAGVVSVTHVRACTRTDERFFSHRRATEQGATTGRFAGLVAIPGPRPAG